MRKMTLYSLLALGLATLATQVYQSNAPVLAVAPDIPPPDCGPTGCTQ